MKKLISYLAQDNLTLAGLILICLSALVFVLTPSVNPGNGPGMFFINYLLSGGYLLAVLIRTIKQPGWLLAEESIVHTVLLLVLWFISAFALNLDMNVFERSVDWLSVWIVVSAFTFVLAGWFRVLPKVVAYPVFFLLGSSLLLFSYYAIYLMPLYLVSLPGLIALGISLHTFIPLFMAFVSLVIIIRAFDQSRILPFLSALGVLLPLIICLVFLQKWNTVNRQISRILNQNILNEGKLPPWIAVSQQIQKSFVSERIIKAGLVYHEADRDANFFWGGMPSRSFNEPRMHDPLVVLATMLYKRPNLDETDRIKILKSMNNARHQAQERLWWGDNLETASVISNVLLFPEYRMAYTEKTLSIRNTSGWQWNQQEAIYTFHLQEGSVISSLSLWIKGVEEKSRLTTKSKADSAYNRVVGIEVRDPSVVHWQEGNTVSVRVFPCAPVENRLFKIGISSPMRKEGDSLYYENAFFEGPDASEAIETVRISFSKEPDGLEMPAEFKQVSPGVFEDERTYKPGWELVCKAPTLAKTGFRFNGTSYQLNEYVEKYEDFSPKRVYIDLNSSWSAKEFKQVWAMLRTKPVYVFDERLIRLSNENLSAVYEQMSKYNFSLFPVNKIDQADSALLISKSNDLAPNLGDLENTEFAKELSTYLAKPKHIRFFNLGNQLSPYLNALKELRVFNYSQGNEEALGMLLERQQFVKDQENDVTVVLTNAQISIQKVDSVKIASAPDHLLRIFAYNDLMRKAGSQYFSKDYVRPDLIAEAEAAHIVSPVSSMIVLETVKDYERFGINESKNSLKNASMKSSGAVPEPHEWLLIILALGIAVWLIFKPKVSAPVV